LPRPRFFKLPEERRRTILDEAAREIAANGYEGASLNALLERCGVSKGAFYYYFEDKADLFATVLEDLVETYDGVVGLRPETLDADNYWRRFRERAERVLHDLAERPWLVDLGRRIHALTSELPANSRIAEVMARLEADLAQVIERGQELGVIRDDVPAALLLRLFYAIDRVFTDWLSEDAAGIAPEERDRLVVASLEMVKRMSAP